jgi:single-strand DNA-binding protein
MNSVNLIGRLTRDPESRTTQQGKKVVNFTLAVDRRFKSDDKSADFFNVQAWDKTADFIEQYLGKGRLVGVTGRLQQRSYTDQNGNKREVVEVIAESVQGLDRVRDDAKPATDDYDPFAEGA